MLPDSEFKAKTLAHCLALAERDPEYALWAAQQYEAMCPWCLKNLAAKVQQELRRKEAGHEIHP